VISVLRLIGTSEAEVAGFFQRPWNAVFMGLFVLLSCIHMSLGIQVVIDDYVHHPGRRIFLLLLNRAFAWLVAAISLVALLRIVI
jgi:succinate dehydrogenase / fumarate reductase membrane anchor subunit